jgi:hypothetical protein
MGNVTGLFVREDLDLFGRTFERYAALSGKTRQEALAHTARNFKFFLFKRLGGAVAQKGQITQERLAAMKGGEGIKISSRAREIVYRDYGVRFAFATGIKPASPTMGAKGSKFFMVGAADKKRGLTKKQQEQIEGLNKKAGGGLTLQALLAKQELKLREGHRMFTASSSRFRGDLSSTTYSTSGLGRPLGRGQPSHGQDVDTFTFDWGSQVGEWSGVAARGLNAPSRRHLFNPALNDTRQDMMTYIYRKQQENGRRAARIL